MFRRAGLIAVLSAVLVLTGSWHLPSLVSASANLNNSNTLSDAAIRENQRVFGATYAKGRYVEGHEIFLRMARDAERRGLTAEAIADWNNAGGCSLASLQFKSALKELSRSREIALRSGDRDKAARASNNIASLNLQMGNFDAALRIASDALNPFQPGPKPDVIAKLEAQQAVALASLYRLPQARPVFLASISALDDLFPEDPRKDNLRIWDAAVRTRGMFGHYLVQAGRLDEAEPVLVEALRLARVHHVQAANVLDTLALLETERHDSARALRLFDAALAEPPGATPRWLIYADRGEFRLEQGDAVSALADFRDARRLASDMRADVVPVDEDRVALESGLGRIAAGIVNADNRLALSSRDRDRLRESFDVAEQDRQWSLRALVPAPDDWRTRLPSEYWDLLAQYQALARVAAGSTAGPAAERAGALALRLQTIEATAGRDTQSGASSGGARPSALNAAQKALPPGAVLFSFYTGPRNSWLWAITNSRFDLYPIPSSEVLAHSIDSFVAGLRSGKPDSVERARELYSTLFGGVAREYLDRNRWLLELDGPLYNLPFSALVTSAAGQPPKWLIERASIETIPGALMMESGPARSSASSFVGIADPVYNAADSRYNGRRGHVESSLSRLPNTEAEVKNCASAWGCPRNRLLTGMDASPASVEAALRSQPAVIHFATHVVSGESDHGSGVIALSLNRQGSLGLLGPREILARPVNAELVVLDGCHSAQGAALPGAGLMGLTRAWIGAGAHAVLATLWDIPDDAQSALPAFYSSLRAHPELGPAAALRDAQLQMLSSGKGADPAAWAGYFLLARR